MLILEDIATFLKGESLYYIKGKELTEQKEREEQHFYVYMI